MQELFQFLIGRLVTFSGNFEFYERGGFQFLIGRLVTSIPFQAR